MFFENRRQLLHVVIWLAFICSVGFLSGLAWGQPNQDCKYVTNISYDANGQIVNANQTYECKTPVVVAQNTAQPSYNNIQQPQSNTVDFIEGLTILGLLLKN